MNWSYEIEFHYTPDLLKKNLVCAYLLCPVIDFLGTDLDSLDMNFAQALVEIQDILPDDYDYLETPVACFPTDFHWGYYMELDKDRTHRLIRQWPGVVEAPLKT